MPTFDGVKLKLQSWGYKVHDGPTEQRPPNDIEMKYDLKVEVEDIACTSYILTHSIELSWLAPTPGGIANQVTTLMARLGSEYSGENHFAMSGPELRRGNGTTYTVMLVMSWMTFEVVDT